MQLRTRIVILLAGVMCASRAVEAQWYCEMPGSVANTVDFFVTTTPACQGSTCSGVAATAMSPSASREAIYPASCQGSVFYWWKGLPNPWAREVHFLRNGWIYANSEANIQNGWVTWERLWHNGQGVTGTPRIPGSVSICFGVAGSPGYDQAHYHECPSLGTNPYAGYHDADWWVYDQYIKVGWEDWWILDCRGAGDACPDLSQKVQIEVIVHQEPAADRTERYAFGRWVDPRTGLTEGLGLVGYDEGYGQGWRYYRYLFNSSVPSGICPECPSQ